MRNKIILLLTLMSGVLFSQSVFALTQQQLMQQLQKAETVQGDFTQTRFLQALPVPIKSTGTFAFALQKGLLWQMQKPFATTLRVTPRGIAQWANNQWQASQNPIQNQQIALFLGLLSGDMSALEKEFKITLSGQANHWQLSLIPDTLLLKQIFTQITLKGDKAVRQIVLQEKQGDKTQIDFTQLKVNQPLPLTIKKAFQ